MFSYGRSLCSHLFSRFSWFWFKSEHSNFVEIGWKALLFLLFDNFQASSMNKIYNKAARSSNRRVLMIHFHLRKITVYMSQWNWNLMKEITNFSTGSQVFFDYNQAIWFQTIPEKIKWGEKNFSPIASKICPENTYVQRLRKEIKCSSVRWPKTHWIHIMSYTFSSGL